MNNASNNILISEATPSGYRDIYALQLNAYVTEDELYDYTIPPLLQTFEKSLADLKRSTVLKAVDNNTIIGSIRAYRDENNICHINKLMVDPNFRKRGIGTALLKEIENRFSGCLYKLFTGLKSHGNIRLYECNGYKLYRVDEENDLALFSKT